MLYCGCAIFVALVLVSLVLQLFAGLGSRSKATLAWQAKYGRPNETIYSKK